MDTDDGSLSTKKRELALQNIRENPEVTVILISFKAGSVGLNLTACNHVILFDGDLREIFVRMAVVGADVLVRSLVEPSVGGSGV